MRKSPPPIEDEAQANGSSGANDDGAKDTLASISSNSDRGSLSSDEGTSGETLLPMLIGGLALIVLGTIIVFILA
jgi:hypothetical protein